MVRRIGLRAWMLCLLVAILLLAAVGFALLILINNVSFPRLSRADFTNRLDRSLAASTSWAAKQFPSDGSGRLMVTDLGAEFASNPALVHMLVDLSKISADPRLQELSSRVVAEYRRTPVGLAGKMVDPTIAEPPLVAPNMEEYQRWMLHAISPEELPLSDAERADMFSTGKLKMYNLTHQLFAFYFARKFHGETPELHALMDRAEQNIATEATYDFRVTDLYLERIAFLLAAGRPDLVKPRWVERSLAAQQSDGGWRYTWGGWGPHVLRYAGPGERSLAHSTVLGMWLTNMLKYRYPEWIAKNYQ
ncbi:MAG TPA: hypothetical protein VIJ63_00600 [Roseiarcus sp.]